MRHRNTLSRIRRSVCNAVTFESLDLESAFLIYGVCLQNLQVISVYQVHWVHVKVIGASKFCLAFVMLLVVAYIVLLASVVHCNHGTFKDGPGGVDAVQLNTRAVDTHSIQSHMVPWHLFCTSLMYE